MEWEYQYLPVTDLDDEVFGFVYKITNMLTGKFYIGKKQARFKKTLPPLKGKKRRRITYVESDWRDYYGSNTELQKDVYAIGAQYFRREILHFASSSGQLSYLELKEQMRYAVLERDDSYNGIIQVKIHKNHIKGKKLLDES